MTGVREASSPVLANIDHVLSAVAEQGALSASQIAEVTGVPRPSVYRLIESLTGAGMLVALPDGTVELGTRFLRLGARAQASMPEVRAARGALEELRGASGHTSYLCTRRGDSTVCIDWRQGGVIGLPVLRPGMILPSHAGAASLALLSADRTYLEAVLASAPFEVLAPRTPTTAGELRDAVDAVRTRGFSISDEDVTRGVAAVGVPMVDHKGRVRGALSLSGVRSSILPQAEELAAMLMEAARTTLHRLNLR